MPKSNTVFWQAKFSANQERDARNIRQLTELNWNVIIVWECQIRTFQKEGVRFIKEVLTLCEKETMRSYTRLTASPEDNHHVRNLYGAISTPLNQPAGPFVQQLF